MIMMILEVARVQHLYVDAFLRRWRKDRLLTTSRVSVAVVCFLVASRRKTSKLFWSLGQPCYDASNFFQLEMRPTSQMKTRMCMILRSWYYFFSCIITHGRVDVWNDKELWLATTDQNKKTTKKQNKQHPPNKPNTFWSHQWQKVNKLSIWFISWISMSSPSEYLVLLVRGSYGQKDWNNRKKTWISWNSKTQHQQCIESIECVWPGSRSAQIEENIHRQWCLCAHCTMNWWLQLPVLNILV